jgi:hypothetical protein
MVVEKLDKEKITVSFSGAVGRKGLDIIKSCIEDIEKNGVPKKVPQKVINELSRSINKKVWERIKTERNIK